MTLTGKSPKREVPQLLAASSAVGGMTALALFDLLKPNYALATQVEFTGPEVVAEYITYPSPNGHGEVTGSSGEARKDEQRNASCGGGA